MVAIISCDHHGASNTISDRRSRVAMVAQLRVARALAGAFAALGPVRLDLSGPLTGQVTLDAERFQALYRAYRDWRAIEPNDDDLDYPPQDTRGIRVPPDASEPIAVDGPPEPGVSAPERPADAGTAGSA